MKKVFSPGCALMIYKPDLAKKVSAALNDGVEKIEDHLICCRHEPNLPKGTQIINTCAGCDKRFRELYEGITTVSLWEVIDQNKSFRFPDYNGKEMSIQDACPTRDQERVHNAVRGLLAKMNIKVIEPVNTKTKATCCGDSFYGVLPVERVKGLMKKRAEEMPCEEVVVYCVSCVKSMVNGGRKPRYLVDLLFGEETLAGETEPEAWHKQVDDFIQEH